jgi:AcrR family transcriptional regulator
MARKESITRSDILTVAFEMAKEETDGVTARKLATRAGCSTQPIFRVFKSMDELERELFDMAAAFFTEFYNNYQVRSEVPFVNLGMAYIRFAMENKCLYSRLFVSEKRYGKTLYDLINGEAGVVAKEIAKAKAAGYAGASRLFMKMWILIHGAASMSLTGDYDLGDEDTMKLLEDSYRAFTA